MFKRLLVVAVAMLIGSAAITVAEPVEVAEAAVTNCTRGTGGTYAWGFCAGTNGNPPYTTQHIVLAVCVRPWYLGGGSYQGSGNWVNVGFSSHFYCAPHYNATNPWSLYR